MSSSDSESVLTRDLLLELLCIPAIARDTGSTAPQASRTTVAGDAGFQREGWTLEVEPGVAMPFWLLRPDGPGPFPLAILPHGHGTRGRDVYAGLVDSDERRAWMLREDRDVAVQAVRRGFMAIAPTVRGFDELAESDSNQRHNGWHCLSTYHLHLARGRILTGERVWDMMRLLDWATMLPEVDAARVLMMGNSCGGMVTSYAAACDERITMAVPSCSFAAYLGTSGRLQHHGCNTVPGILNHGEFWDVLALIAPRHLLVVHGKEDALFTPAEVERAMAALKQSYAAQGADGRCHHRLGEGGHRFYADLMWPLIEQVLCITAT